MSARHSRAALKEGRASSSERHNRSLLSANCSRCAAAPFAHATAVGNRQHVISHRCSLLFASQFSAGAAAKERLPPSTRVTAWSGSRRENPRLAAAQSRLSTTTYGALAFSVASQAAGVEKPEETKQDTRSTEKVPGPCRRLLSHTHNRQPESRCHMSLSHHAVVTRRRINLAVGVP